MAEIAIIGAGMAGLAAGAALATAGHAVRVYEKSGGLGGRLATRRSPAGGFDHGAPGFTAAEPSFSAFLAAAARGGHTAPWPGGDATLLSTTPGPAHVGLPGASGAVRTFLGASAGHEELEIQRRTEVTAIAKAPSGAWQLGLSEGTAEAEHLLLAIPAPQAARLLATAGLSNAPVEAVIMAPRLTAMVAFEAPITAPEHLSPVLEKAIRETGKPGRAEGHDRWVLHATSAWSAENIEHEKDDIADALIAAFAESTGPLPTATYRAGHRWRYALTTAPLGQACHWDPEARLGFCGDWCLGDTVEHAFLSGNALASAVVKDLS
ncbi:MAG: NAD(P)-binding protein [Pseudomonadota bacterium]